MRAHNPFETLHSALASATYQDLSDIVYKRRIYPNGRDSIEAYVEETRRPAIYDVSIEMFEQTWSDTSLGFGGIAGQAFTSAYTVVISMDYHEWAVYHGGRYAYTVFSDDKGFELFREHMLNHCLAGKMECKKYK